MLANFDTWPGARNMTGTPAFSAAGQNQSAVPSVSQGRGVGGEGDADAEHSALLLPSSQQRRGIADFGAGIRPITPNVGIALDGSRP